MGDGTSGPVLDRGTLNRTLLARQSLTARTDRSPLEVIEHLVGLQAQEPPDPYVALWSRIAGFDPLVVSHALEARDLVRIGTFRTTLHLMTTADAIAIAPVTAAVHARTFRNTPFAKQLAGADERAIVAMARVLLEAEPLTPRELGARLATRWPDRDPTSLALLARYHLSLVQIPPRGLWRRTSRTMNTTLEHWSGRTPDPIDVAGLLRRYLRAFGPASVGDMRTWSGLTGLREVVDAMRPRLRPYRDARGRELFDVEDGVLADPAEPAPVRFLPQYDNVFLSHDDRSRVAPEGHRTFDYAFKGPILIDGVISAAWRVRRATAARAPATMTVELARAVTASQRDELIAEATRLATFLDPDRPRELILVDAPPG